MADPITLGVPIVVGLIGVLFAILDRGYGRYLEQKKEDPTLKFGGPYLLNFLVSTGISSVIVVTIIPALITGLGTAPEVTVAASILQFVLGYTTAYTALSKMNTSTERKLAAAKEENPQ